ncbi:unnamed protein product [Closterium sp. NIES-65]|nr:unnamed protein product [Closterium sp. NIES-65]
MTMSNATVTEVAMAEMLAQLAAVEAEWVSVAERAKGIVHLTTGIWRMMAAFIVLFMQCHRPYPFHLLFPPPLSTSSFHLLVPPPRSTTSFHHLVPPPRSTTSFHHLVPPPIPPSQLGFSLIEAGTVRYKNTRNIMIKNVLDMCVSAIAFWLIGFAIGFGSGSDFIGWQTPSGTVSMAVVPHESGALFFFNFVFCATSATIFAGAVAERTQITAYLFFNFFLAAIIYPVIAHVIWSHHGLLSVAPVLLCLLPIVNPPPRLPPPSFFLAAIIYPVIAHVIWSHHGLLSADAGDYVLGTRGVLDNAGSMVVHVTGGWVVDGHRGHHHPLAVFIAAGTIILWVGFFGFNGGSVQYLGQPASVWVADVARVCANTTVCAAFAGVAVWFVTYRRREPNLEDTLNGVIGGLVAACATSSIVEAYAACIIGECMQGAGGSVVRSWWATLADTRPRV